MNQATVLLGAFALAVCAAPAFAQHHDYEIVVDNHTRRDLHVVCHDESGHGHELASAHVHSGESTTLYLEGGEHLHAHCRAGRVSEQSFEFDHRHSSHHWEISNRHRHDDHHD